MVSAASQTCMHTFLLWDVNISSSFQWLQLDGLRSSRLTSYVRFLLDRNVFLGKPALQFVFNQKVHVTCNMLKSNKICLSSKAFLPKHFFQKLIKYFSVYMYLNPNVWSTILGSKGVFLFCLFFPGFLFGCFFIF